MYSDQISTVRKRSIHERLDSDLPAGSGAGGRARHNVSKRQRQIDEKWKHDLYREDDESASKSMDPRDLRLKLQRRSSQSGFTQDLREKLSGTMHPPPSNADPPKPKPISEDVKITRRENAAEIPVRQSKKASKHASSKKISQPKVESPLDSFLSSLGLEKYSITFQAEEVVMAALRQMTDSDLKALGIPMISRLHSRSLSVVPNYDFSHKFDDLLASHALHWNNNCSLPSVIVKVSPQGPSYSMSPIWCNPTPPRCLTGPRKKIILALEPRA